MAETTLTDTGGPAAPSEGVDGFVSDWSSDQRNKSATADDFVPQNQPPERVTASAAE